VYDVLMEREPIVSIYLDYRPTLVSHTCFMCRMGRWSVVTQVRFDVAEEKACSAQTGEISMQSTESSRTSAVRIAGITRYLSCVMCGDTHRMGSGFNFQFGQPRRVSE